MLATLLTLCAMHFSVAQAPPQAWQDMIASRTGCAMHLAVDDGSVDRVPIARLNDFFPRTVREWPLLDARRKDLVSAADVWLSRGVTPGVVLPSDSTLLRGGQLRAVRKLARTGVAFVVRPPEGSYRFSGMATLYSAMGILVNGVYLERGYSPELSVLPQGLYLVAPHWRDRPDLPILQGDWIDHGRHFVVLPSQPLSRDHQIAGTPYTPTLGQSWNFSGLRYTVDGAGEHTSMPGWIMQSMVGLLVPLQLIKRAPMADVAAYIGAGLAWVGILFGLVSIMVLIFGAFRRLPLQ